MIKNLFLKFWAIFRDKTNFRFFSIFEIIKKLKSIKGDIIEFGVWNGNNLLTIKKTIEYLNINKTIIGFDHLKGCHSRLMVMIFQEIKSFYNIL